MLCIKYDKKYMKTLLVLTSLSFSALSMATEKPFTNTYLCIEKGCSLACMNIKNNWSTVSDKAKQVTVSHYTSGKIEYFFHFDNKTRGDEAIHISEPRLKCKLSGIKQNT